MNINIKRINPFAIIPKKSSDGAAGFDLFNCEKDVELLTGDNHLFKIGFIIEIPENFVGYIYARSGLGCKNGIIPRNCVGVIDSDYRGEIMVCLQNNGTEKYTIHTNDKIAQLIISEIPNVQLVIKESLTETKRGMGGFGSTGI